MSDETRGPNAKPVHDEALIRDVLERIDVPDLVGEAIGDFERSLTEAVRSAVDYAIGDEGICSYDFHRSVAEFRRDGSCGVCGAPWEVHVAILTCPREEWTEDDNAEEAEAASLAEDARPPRRDWKVRPDGPIPMVPINLPGGVDVSLSPQPRAEPDLSEPPPAPPYRPTEVFTCAWPGCGSFFAHPHDDDCHDEATGAECRYLQGAGWEPAVIRFYSVKGGKGERRLSQGAWFCPDHATTTEPTKADEP